MYIIRTRTNKQVRVSVWYTHEHLLLLVFERQFEISYVSRSRITSVSKRNQYVRKAHHLRVGFAIGIASNTLQDLRLLVPGLEQSSAFCSQQIGGEKPTQPQLSMISAAKVRRFFGICKIKEQISQIFSKLCERSSVDCCLADSCWFR